MSRQSRIEHPDEPCDFNCLLDGKCKSVSQSDRKRAHAMGHCQAAKLERSVAAHPRPSSTPQACWVWGGALPDSDITVLVRLSDDEYPLVIAYHDGTSWVSTDGQILEGPVTGWMHLDAAASILDSKGVLP